MWAIFVFWLCIQLCKISHEGPRGCLGVQPQMLQTHNMQRQKRQRHVMNYCSRLSIRQGHSRRPTEIKFCTRLVSRLVLEVKFHQNQVNGFGDVRVVQAATTIEILVHLDATNVKFEAWGQTSCRWRKMLLKWSLRPRVGAFQFSWYVELSACNWNRPTNKYFKKTIIDIPLSEHVAHNRGGVMVERIIAHRSPVTASHSYLYTSRMVEQTSLKTNFNS